jgi:hypothetical protein
MAHCHLGLDDLAVMPLRIRREQRAHLLLPLVLLGIPRIFAFTGVLRATSASAAATSSAASG